MTSEEIKGLTDENHMPTYGRFDVALTAGRGAALTDAEGRAYLDFGSGIGVSALGQTDPDWVKAVSGQAGRLGHISNLYYNDVQAGLAKALCAAAGMARVFFGNSGAEANECAIKLARKYSFDKYGTPERGTILCLTNSFHGRTLATLAATGQDAFHNYFFPFPAGFAFAAPGDIEDVKAKIDGSMCAVMLECVQGEGGVMPLDPAFLRAVRQLCDEKDLLLIVDEVQTGVGRTGTFLACRGMGVRPDIVTLAKGLGGGLPIGACLCGEGLENVLSAGAHGSTFGGNPIVCAGARVVLEKVTAPGFLEDVARKGEKMRAALGALPGVREVRGRGLMLGLVLEDGIAAPAVAKACLEAGLLVLTAKTLVRLLPPLTVTDDEIDKGLAILGSVLRKWEETI